MSSLARGNVLVACMGDVTCGDGGFGAAVARELEFLDLPDQAAVVDFGIRGLDLACALLEPWSAVVIVGAAVRGGIPGEIHLCEVEPEAEAFIYARAADPGRVVALARTMGEITAPVYMVGCEPDDWGDSFDRQVGLSRAVGEAIPEATRMVEWLIRQRLPVEAAAGPRG